MRRARAAGIRTAYDANGGDGWDNPAALRSLKDEIYPETDFIFLNAAEACSLTGQEDPAKAAQAVRPESATVVVKRGADGSVCRDRDGNVRLECTCGLVISGKTDPDNPLADDKGYVQGAVVDLAGQMGDLILASRSYQANMSVFKEARDALQVATTLGRG